MENKKDAAEEYVRRIVTPIFKRFLKEPIKNLPLVGPPGKPYCFYQPHNYRLYIDFTHQEETTTTHIKRPRLIRLGSRLYKGKIVNSTEILYKLRSFNIKIKKTQIEITNKIRHKRWFKITLGTKAELQIRRIVKQKDKECLKALESFIQAYGGDSKFKILNRHSENKIMNERIIDLLPLKQKWHTKPAQKVYNEPNVEFKDPAMASTYIVNRCIEELAPEIGKGLKNLGNMISVMNPLRVLEQRTKTIKDVIENSWLVMFLTKEEKAHYEEWILKNVGSDV